MSDDPPEGPAISEHSVDLEESAEAEVTDLRAAWRAPFGWRSLWSARTLSGERLTARQRLWRGSSVALAVLLALLVIFAGTRANVAPASSALNTATTSAARLVIPPPLPQVDSLTCVLDGAWAPDSSRYAVLGYGGGCDAAHGDPGQVNLYSPPSTLVARLEPNAAIWHAAGALPPLTTNAAPGATGSGSGVAPVLYYNSLLWSPDGRRLAVTFTLLLSSQPYTGYYGVYLATVAGNQQQVLLTPDLFTSGTTYLDWDLSRGQPFAQMSFSSASPFFGVNVPVALGYQWTSDGRLAPYDSANSAVPTGPSPIGSPAADPIFTLWQPGQISLVNQSPDGTSYPTGAYDWVTSFSAWSPDGRYLLDDVVVAGRLVPPGKPHPSAATLAGLQMNTLPVLPLRDAGLRQALLSLTSSASAGQSLSLAWRPDGRVLAATDGGNLTLYDCATGQSRSVEAPLPVGHGLAGVQSLLRWSPDGRWLLLSGLRILDLSQPGIASFP